jgi:ribonucleotide monophosphatase NagD (HAD superfamily)
VGDLLRTDIAGAQGVGMKAVQYTGITTDDWLAATEAPAKTVTPDAVISSHTQLGPLLHRWNGFSYRD